MRTTLALDGDLPVQVVADRADVHLPVEDLSQAAPAAREERMRTLLQRDADEPFDLVRGPLWRAKLYRLAHSAHLPLFPAPPPIWDRRALHTFTREIHVGYRPLKAR